jgi:maltoporin
VLYGVNNPAYPNSSSWAASGLNISFQGSVFWLSALIIWVGDTFTQRYNLSRIDWKCIPYSLLGVFLFYVGLSSALNITSLGL